MAKATMIRSRNGEQLQGYYCDQCCEIFVVDEDCEGPDTNETLYKHRWEPVHEENGTPYFEEKCESVDAWRCQGGCWHPGESEPEMSQAYECSECEQKFLERDSAADCCL